MKNTKKTNELNELDFDLDVGVDVPQITHEEEKGEYSQEQLIEMLDKLDALEEVFEVVEYNDDMISSIMATEQYKTGHDIGTKYAAMFTTLMNFGMTKKQAYEMCITQLAGDVNIVISKVQNLRAKQSSL